MTVRLLDIWRMAAAQTALTLYLGDCYTPAVCIGVTCGPGERRASCLRPSPDIPGYSVAAFAPLGRRQSPRSRNARPRRDQSIIDERH
jgi:hypothetical protein